MGEWHQNLSEKTVTSCTIRPNVVALKMDGAGASNLYRAVDLPRILKLGFRRLCTNLLNIDNKMTVKRITTIFGTDNAVNGYQHTISFLFLT